ncbi:MAG TPA: hypothetical protein VMB51_03985 [Solirubrobacteraceae bacterium]|nr:hypothetical protein [Solirubrobacteraceae bacterium]
MGDGIQINRVAERFSSHTQPRPPASARRRASDTKAVRDKLIEAIAEVIGEGSDPRLGQSRARS